MNHPVHLVPRTSLVCERCKEAAEHCAACHEPFRSGEAPVLCVVHAGGHRHLHAKCRGKATRRQEICRDGDGAYALVFQRTGEDPIVDLAFFDGNRPLADLKLRLEILREALELALAWKAGGPWL